MFIKWLQRKSMKPQDRVHNAVYLALHKAMRERAFLDVVVAGDTVIYQSIMLELDPVECTVLIDELFPGGFVGMPGQKLEVTVRQEAGKKLKFETEVIEHNMHDGTPLYILKMPDTLAGDQRRRAFRLPIASRLAIEPSFCFPDQLQPSRGLLKNVSTMGVALEVPGDLSSSLRHGDLLKGIEFDFAGVGVSCDLAVRNIQLASDKTVVGGEFMGLPMGDQEMLSRSILRVQRQRLKHAAATEQSFF